MEVELRPDVQGKLDAMAKESGQSPSELVEDALIGYFDELAYARETLDRRYDDLESGRVKPIGLEDVRRMLKAKTDEQRSKTLQR
jgi:predicted transcriptional regulator